MGSSLLKFLCMKINGIHQIIKSNKSFILTLSISLLLYIVKNKYSIVFVQFKKSIDNLPIYVDIFLIINYNHILPNTFSKH